MKKRIVEIITVVILAETLAACGTNTNNKNANSSEKNSSSVESAETDSDLGISTMSVSDETQISVAEGQEGTLE